jgi:choline kinase
MLKTKTAIILAAGRGSRLKELSLEQPKPMTEVNNVSIISNLIRQIIENDINKIVVVIGYLAGKLKEHILEKYDSQAEFVFIENKVFDKTNNIYSLYLAEQYMHEGFYLFEADVFCNNKIMQALCTSPYEDIILVDKYTSQMNGTVVRFDKNFMVSGMYLNKDQTGTFNYSDTYKTINFYKIGKEFLEDFFIKKLRAHIDGQDVNSYYEQIIKEAIDKGHKFHCLVTANHNWWEIDTIEDLEKAEFIFKNI